MPKPVALTRTQAVKSLANRLAPRVDRIRQIATRLGIRPYRVFLVWAAYTGDERGEGHEVLLNRVELLPTPKVESMDNMAFNPFAIGTIPVGMLRVTLISVAYTRDLLSGHWEPEQHEDTIPQPYDFFWEIVEDGRGDPTPVRLRYRLAAEPMRRAGKVSWNVLLEKVSGDESRDGTLAGNSIVSRCPGGG